MKSKLKIIGIVGLTAIGIAFLSLGLWFYFKGASIQNWPVTEGKIQDTSVVRISRSGSNHSYKPIVTYSYYVSGKEYTNNRLTLISQTFGKEAKAELLIDAYKKGTSVEVHYNPEEPQDSILLQQSPVIAGFIILFGFLVVIAALLLFRKIKR